MVLPNEFFFRCQCQIVGVVTKRIIALRKIWKVYPGFSKEYFYVLVLVSKDLGHGARGECVLNLHLVIVYWNGRDTYDHIVSSSLERVLTNLWFLFLLCFVLGEMAKRTFSSLEAFLIFLLVMMTVITVALLTLLFVTSGTIENNKGKHLGALLDVLPRPVGYFLMGGRHQDLKWCLSASGCPWAAWDVISHCTSYVSAKIAAFIIFTFVRK